MLLINNLANEQAVATIKGNYVATPNVIIYNTGNTKIKVGKFYRPQNQDCFTGIEIIKGSDSKGSRLYPVDASRIPRGWTLTRTDIKIKEEPRYIDIE